MSSSNISFTVRRPSPLSRGTSTGGDSDNDGFKIPPARRPGSGTVTPSPLSQKRTASAARLYADADSSDDEAKGNGTEDEIIDGFDKFGVTRQGQNGRKKEKPLIIPALKNKDWRDAVRAKNAPSYVPGAGAVPTGEDGSVGGLGTRDTINSGPVTAGLVVPKRIKLDADAMEVEGESSAAGTPEQGQAEELTEDQRALRAVLDSAAGAGDNVDDALTIGAIPISGLTPRSIAEREQQAYHRDVEILPDPASMDDYERIPIAQFGAALLRGMGWKEGQAASRKRTGPVEPYLPQQRPSLLGIGAKEKEALDDGSKTKKFKSKRNDMKYMPVAKREKESSAPSSAAASRTGSRRPSRERSPDRIRDKERERERERERDSERNRDRDRDIRRDRDRDRDDTRYSRSERDDRGYGSERDRERNRDKDGERRRDRDRDYGPDRPKESRDRDNRERDRVRDRDAGKSRDKELLDSRSSDRRRDH